EKDRIKKLGSTKEIMKETVHTNKTYDLKGKTVLPGFNDSHLHFLMTAEYLTMLPIVGVTSIEELIQRGKEYLENNRDENIPFLYTEGWNQTQFTDEKRMPDRVDLDKISSEIPIIMARVDRHVFSLNSAALKFAGITADTPSPEGGEIQKDAFGEPTGLLMERAIDIVRAKRPPQSKDHQKEMLVHTMQIANSQGLTSMHVCDCKDDEIYDTFSLYEELEKEEKLTLRFYQQIWFNDGKYLPKYIEKGWKTGQGTSYNRVGPIKLFADGALGGRTAAMRQDYADDSGNKGILTKSQETLDQEVKMAVDNGHQVIIHAIGDKGIETVLDAYDKALGENENTLRLGVNHVQITDLPLLERIRDRHYLAYTQPIFLEDDIPIIEDRVGKDLAGTSYAFGTMHRMGIRQSFINNAPIAPFRPFDNFYCAVTRKRLNGTPIGGFLPDEAVDLYTAIDAYTLESAYASFEEEEKGRLKTGYLADFIVLDRDIFDISPEEMKETVVLQTFSGGKKVFEHENWKERVIE